MKISNLREARPIIGAVLLAILLMAGGRFFRPFRALDAADMMRSFLVVLGPGALSWMFTKIGQRFIRSSMMYLACGVIAALCLLVQTGFWVLAAIIVTGYGGSLVLNPFTLAGLVGIVFSIVALASYCLGGQQKREQ